MQYKENNSRITQSATGFNQVRSQGSVGTAFTTTSAINNLRTTFYLGFACALLLMTLTGCATVAQRNPVPEEHLEDARVPGMPSYVRFAGDKMPEDWDVRIIRMRTQMLARNPESLTRPHNYLAISGGGGDGAFGAGLLCGWTETGKRPSFDAVTGISTGALMAPLAFLGAPYDPLLKKYYTTVATRDIIRMRGKIKMLTGDSVADSKPLQGLIAELMTPQVLEEIAVEFEKGRRLFIGTTHLDARRPVIWNIGAIAASGRPEALELVRKIMLASASIPGVFPPVYINVEAGGQTYDEMHVDGGTSSQVFLYPGAMDLREVKQELGLQGYTRVYVIRNSRLQPQWTPVKPKLLPIARSSIATLIMTQGMGDLYRIYFGALRDKVAYNLAYIEDDFVEEENEAFDPDYMKKLFEYGYRLAKSGYPWHDSPPGFTQPWKRSQN